MIEQLVLLELNEMELEMSSLEITHKKRRLSGILKRDTVKMAKPEEVVQESEESAPLRRSSRKRTAPVELTGAGYSALVKPPQLNVDHNMEEIKKIYLDKNVKRLNPSLETIFEDPVNKKYMSARKFRRVLTFEGSYLHVKKKTEKRMMKAKKVTAQNRVVARKKISMNFLMTKLATIEAEKD